MERQLALRSPKAAQFTPPRSQFLCWLNSRSQLPNCQRSLLEWSGHRQNAEDRDFLRLHPLEALQWSRRIKIPGQENQLAMPAVSSREIRL